MNTICVDVVGKVLPPWGENAIFQHFRDRTPQCVPGVTKVSVVDKVLPS